MTEHRHDPAETPSAAHLDHAPDQAYWDDRYSTSDRIWSGRANPQLVAEAEHLEAGRALDVGSGEGGDAVWLASRGWTVTAIDLSEVALSRAEAAAADTLEAGDAARITWEHHDVLTWTPPEAAFDLVSAQYAHFPSADMAPLTTRLAAAVAPGGTLLVVGHEKTGHHSIGPDFFFTAGDLGALLDPALWSITAELRAHPHREGSDEVMVARRR